MPRDIHSSMRLISTSVLPVSSHRPSLALLHRQPQLRRFQPQHLNPLPAPSPHRFRFPRRQLNQLSRRQRLSRKVAYRLPACSLRQKFCLKQGPQYQRHHRMQLQRHHQNRTVALPQTNRLLRRPQRQTLTTSRFLLARLMNRRLSDGRAASNAAPACARSCWASAP